MSERDVEVYIDRLVLRGLQPSDGVDLGPLVEQALTEALAGVTLDPSALAAGARRGPLKAPGIALSGPTAARDLAPRIAQAVKGGLTR